MAQDASIGVCTLSQHSSVPTIGALPVRATEPSEYRQPVMTVLVQIAEQKFHRNGDSIQIQEKYYL